jgi:hypothetical protein
MTPLNQTLSSSRADRRGYAWAAPVGDRVRALLVGVGRQPWVPSSAVVSRRGPVRASVAVTGQRGTLGCSG